MTAAKTVLGTLEVRRELGQGVATAWPCRAGSAAAPKRSCHVGRWRERMGIGGRQPAWGLGDGGQRTGGLCLAPRPGDGNK